jgi:hypothetical protein
MEFTSYPLVSHNTSSLNTGSYLNRTEYTLFVDGYVPDLWFGFSSNDVVEFGVWDRENNFIGWNVLNQSKSFNEITLSYLNTLDFPVTYSYTDLLTDFTLYKNETVLVSPTDELKITSGQTEGSFFMVHNFTREMAGNINEPLIIKDISPSRKELKLVPISSSNAFYNAFCRKKVLLRDVSPLYLRSVKNFPYEQIYSKVSSLYKSEINTIKSVFFLNTDGAVVTFLKNLYEDFIIFTTTPTVSEAGASSSNDRLIRIQGIQTYFNNFLLSNSDVILDFIDIDVHFNGFVSASIERKFSPIGKNPSEQYVKAKEFVYDFFTKFYYQPISDTLSSTYNEKYYSYLKNGLNFGDNRILLILDSGMMDERQVPDDPLTLLVKLTAELPNDIMVQSKCWVSNISLAPYVVNAVVRTPSSKVVHKIGAPNFSLPIPNISLANTNISYTAEDLQRDNEIDREVIISKNLAELNVDYTDFRNFVIFSSAEVRLNIFKNKAINLSAFSSSIKTLDNKNNQFISNSGSTYPFYSQERENIQNQINDIVISFDGYESYLYRSGNYEYSGSGFVSSSYVVGNDISASAYDKTNRDSLINNCPEHILADSRNDDYIIFVSMIGHFFDELYAYISNLPSEKIVGQSSTEEFTRRVVDYMLETFGWTLDDSLEQADLINNFLTDKQVSSLGQMSAEDRLKTIRNRVLFNLPQIYKTKGTEESVRLLLACYGIPSVLLSIREYGGIDYSSDSAAYTTYERSYMYQWNTSSIYDTFRIPAPSNVNTYLTKISIDSSEPYTYGKQQILFGRVSGSAISSSISGSGEWAVGFERIPRQNSGKVFFRIGYKGAEQFSITSSEFPLFDGNVYSVMLRRNTPSEEFQTSSNVNAVPCRYDLYVQRNEFGRRLVCLTSSQICYTASINQLFDISSTGSYIMLGGWFSHHNGQGYTGTMDKWQMWYDPITDSNFEDYVNHINSYSFSGSRSPEKSLIFRMHTDYPFDLRQIESGSLIPSSFDGFSGTASTWFGEWRNSSTYYALSSSTKLNDIFGLLYSPSVDIMISSDPWRGAQELVYDSASCQYISQSTYPFQFKVIDYPSTLAITKYGPNKFRNEKIRHISQSVATRFDDKDRSTFLPRNSNAPDSNQIGFFVDPQDFKNKDIIRFFGNYDFMDAIGDPSNQFTGNYDTLRSFRSTYAKSKNEYSGSKTLFNELMILYKFYFNRSIFEAIKNLTPARANTLVGVIIEPTILERPKYQSKPLFGESNTGSVFYADITASHYFRDPNTKLLRTTMSLEYGEFNLDTSLISQFDTPSLPSNLTMDVDVKYINLPSVAYPVNYLPQGTYVPDVLDEFQMGHYGSHGAFLQLKAGDLTNGRIPFDMTREDHPSGSLSYYLLKRWKKYTIYSKSGSWNRTDNVSDNLYVTSSTYLYDYVVVTDTFFNTIAYTGSIVDSVPGEAGSEVSPTQNLWTHYPNTFQNSPNGRTNNYLLTQYFNGLRDIYDVPVILTDQGEYFEIVGGYPRNHFSHKRDLFSLYNLVTYGNRGVTVTSGLYLRNQQTIDTTVGSDGLTDGSPPIQSIQVGNLNLIQTDNVINR